MVKLVVLEDCHLYCEGIRSWLMENHSIVISNFVEDWETYQTVAGELNNFITVTSMYWIDSHIGIGEFSTFHKNHPAIRVFCMNLKNKDLRSVKLFDTEIKGFVTRRATKEEFIFGLNEVIKGRFYISTEQIPSGLNHLDGPAADLSVPNLALSNREIEILNLISFGFSDKEIGNKLNISKRTVDNYRHKLLLKFGAKNSPNLVKYAIAGKYISGAVQLT